MAYIKMRDVMKVCEDYSQHCFNSNDARGQDIADRILDDVVALPTADVMEVKHGQWLDDIVEGTTVAGVDFKGVVGYKCSLCGRHEIKKEPYCNCGAKMDGERKENND